MKIPSFGQISFLGDPLREPDRNFEKGGRSFYFFDFDDNVVHLDTKIVVFRKGEAVEVEVPTSEFADVHPLIGKKGSPWESFEIRTSDALTGSFRNFREQPKDQLAGRQQPLIEDMVQALANPLVDWRGPSWSFFVHAVNHTRPISIITARGHHPHTVRRAVNILVQSRDLPANPNFLSVYPVTNPEVRAALGDPDEKLTPGELKRLAIKAAVRDAFECYGESPYHRFGMSDDDPTNVALIREAFLDLKQTFPDNAFYVFNTHGRKLVREEVQLDGSTKSETLSEQTKLF